ncbi:MAG TPA: universal stress protein [Acidobacteriaceae bacterium]|nr:universal stress protein [Acidobacteriaceae bacterium]
MTVVTDVSPVRGKNKHKQKLVRGEDYVMGTIANVKNETGTGRTRENDLPFHAVLLATDCSPSSATVARIAAHFAKDSHAKLYVLHASEPELFGVSVAGPIPELAVMQLDNGRQELHKYAQHIPELRTLKHEESAFLGTAIDGISATVESKSIDLLVLGSHARGGFAKLALGSVAEWAIQRLHCPVLVAGPKCPEVVHPIRSIVFASDLSAETTRASVYARQLAKHYDADFTALHVLHSEKDQTNQSRSESDAVAALRRAIAYSKSDRRNAKCQAVSGEIASSILLAAEQNKANLLILGSRHKPPLTNHIPHAKLTAIIREAHCPVLVVPAV